MNFIAFNCKGVSGTPYETIITDIQENCLLIQSSEYVVKYLSVFMCWNPTRNFDIKHINKLRMILYKFKALTKYLSGEMPSECTLLLLRFYRKDSFKFRIVGHCFIFAEKTHIILRVLKPCQILTFPTTLRKCKTTRLFIYCP